RMTRALTRRGPDDEGFFSEGPAAFGHRRLSIIDLSAAAHQPMLDRELHLVLVFNGTIYNYRELRQELEELGYAFFSQGDSEVILKAYHAWGEKCVEHFHGMFAFAIRDLRHGTLFLARDRFGIKPLYYALEGVRLRFASSVQALLAGGGIDTSLDPIALHHYFSLHSVVPAPRTLLNGIKKLPPATTWLIDGEGRIKQRRYWQLAATRPQAELSEADWLAATRLLLTQAIRRRREAADVPVGVLLSGGLDSSLLVALMAEEAQQGQPLRTFSIGFEDLEGGDTGEKADEFEYSDRVAEHFHTVHHRYRISNHEVLERLPEAIGAMSEPMMSHDAIAFYLLAERVADEVKVVLAGQGADEVFGGYFWYPAMEAASGTPYERFARHYVDREHEEYLVLIDPRHHVGDVSRALIEQALAQPGAETFLDQVWRFDITTLIVEDPVKRVDNMPMAWALEVRVPFLDHELVELAAKMPPGLKLKEGGKFPLKALARGLLPDAVIDRPKGYFPVPVLKYVRGAFLEKMRAILDSPTCRARGLFQRAYVDQLLAAPEAHFTRINGSKLWQMAVLEWWLQLNVDPVSAAGK
ncbi:MAG: N-acetylglutaminylglutamine amidotransferase, partial [Deltaproteobacteria bacterium HGW-Deltaproteobacteria-17]